MTNLIAKEVTATIGCDFARYGPESLWPCDLPIPILQASFCGISLHIGIPPFFHRIVGRPS